MVLPQKSLAMPIVRTLTAGSTIARRIHICHFDDENGRCCVSGKSDAFRNSRPPILSSTTSKATPAHATISSSTKPPRLPSGVSFFPHRFTCVFWRTETGSNWSDGTSSKFSMPWDSIHYPDIGKHEDAAEKQDCQEGHERIVPQHDAKNCRCNNEWGKDCRGHGV